MEGLSLCGCRLRICRSCSQSALVASASGRLRTVSRRGRPEAANRAPSAARSVKPVDRCGCGNASGCVARLSSRRFCRSRGARSCHRPDRLQCRQQGHKHLRHLPGKGRKGQARPVSSIGGPRGTIDRMRRDAGQCLVLSCPGAGPLQSGYFGRQGVGGGSRGQGQACPGANNCARAAPCRCPYRHGHLSRRGDQQGRRHARRLDLWGEPSRRA